MDNKMREFDKKLDEMIAQSDKDVAGLSALVDEAKKVHEACCKTDIKVKNSMFADVPEVKNSSEKNIGVSSDMVKQTLEWLKNEVNYRKALDILKENRDVIEIIFSGNKPNLEQSLVLAKALAVVVNDKKDSMVPDLEPVK